MRTAAVICGLTCILCAVVLLVAGGGDYLKVTCLFTASACRFAVSHSAGWNSPLRTAGAAALVAAFAFAFLGAASVFMADWPSRWYERIFDVLFISVMGALFFGAIGGVIGLVAHFVIWLGTRSQVKSSQTSST